MKTLPANTLRTVILDDNQTFRKFLARFSFIWVVAEAETGEEALETVELCLPDLVIVDIHLPGIDGFDFARLVKTISPKMDKTNVIFTSIDTNPAFYHEAERLNCRFISKESLLDELPAVLGRIKSEDN